MRSEMTATTEMRTRGGLFPKLASRPDSPRRPLRATGTPRQLAHRRARACSTTASVRYPGSDAERSGSAVAGVSERRVREAFSDRHGMPPTAYLRVAALREVRRTLLGGPLERDPVTRATYDFGFWHLSRFAGQYRALFGESPSQTVARARMRAESG